MDVPEWVVRETRSMKGDSALRLMAELYAQGELVHVEGGGEVVRWDRSLADLVGELMTDNTLRVATKQCLEHRILIEEPGTRFDVRGRPRSCWRTTTQAAIGANSEPSNSPAIREGKAEIPANSQGIEPLFESGVSAPHAGARESSSSAGAPAGHAPPPPQPAAAAAPAPPPSNPQILRLLQDAISSTGVGNAEGWLVNPGYAGCLAALREFVLAKQQCAAGRRKAIEDDGNFMASLLIEQKVLVKRGVAIPLVPDVAFLDWFRPAEEQPSNVLTLRRNER